MSQSVAESVLIDGVNNANPPDYVDSDNDDMAVNNKSFSMEQVDKILASEDDNDNAMDSIDPTGTAAIGQSSTSYYNDQNVMDNPIDAANLLPAIPAIVAAGNLPPALLAAAENQQESETSFQNPTN